MLALICSFCLSVISMQMITRGRAARGRLCAILGKHNVGMSILFTNNAHSNVTLKTRGYLQYLQLTSLVIKIDAPLGIRLAVL